MIRERALKVALIFVGTLFSALVYPTVVFLRQQPALSMMLTVYVTLGIFLLLAVSDPPAHRSLIAFTAWSSFAHAVVMGFQASRDMISRQELAGVVVLMLIGVAFLLLAPVRTSPVLTSAALREAGARPEAA